jgi:abhydrolase domain-containing protein 12
VLPSNRNVIAIDYRGYGDSTGSPSEDGLLADATTVWDYITKHAGKPDSNGIAGEEGRSIVVMGHSLGTAVSSRLAGYLADRGTLQGAILKSDIFPSTDFTISFVM